MVTRNITVGQMGAAGTVIAVNESTTYGMAFAKVGLPNVVSMMDDVNGYVSDIHSKIPTTVTTIVASAPKFKAGFGDIPDVQIGGITYAAVVPVAPVVAPVVTRTVSIGQMGAAATPVVINDCTTYREAAKLAGFTTFDSLMSDVGGYIATADLDKPVAPAITMLVLSAPKFKAGFGDIPDVQIGGITYAAVAPVVPVVAPIVTRTVSVGQMGAAATPVVINDCTTYREAAKLAGFATFDSLMSDVGGYIAAADLDKPVAAAITMLVLSAPKFKAGFGDIPDVQIGGITYAAVVPTAVVEPVVAPVVTRTVSVGQMGAAATPVVINDCTTYREAAKLAGFATFDSLMSDVGGYIATADLDTPVAPAITMLVLSAPKFKAGAFPFSVATETRATPASRSINVGQMGQAAKTITITAVTTYRQAALIAGFSNFSGLMSDVGGYVKTADLDKAVGPSVTMLVLSAPKFKAGAFPFSSARTAPVTALRTINVGQMGQAAKSVTIDTATTYRQAAVKAGFPTFEGIMSDVGGYVKTADLDKAVGPSVTMLVLSAPKFKAGN